MKTCLIANRQAGAVDRLGGLLERFAQRANCEILDPDGSGTDSVVRQAVVDGFQRIVVAGGDGTLSQAVNGMAPDFAVELAVLPIGTGNDFARSAGIPHDNLAAAAEIALNGSAHPVDVVKIKNGDTPFFLNAASGGLGGKVASDVDRHDKARWGPFAYWMTAVSKLMELDEYRVSLELDDQTLQMDLYGLTIANGRYVGGGFAIAPTADISDGLLSITAVPVLPTMELLAAGLNFTLGRHEEANRVRTFKSRRAVVRAEPSIPFSIDGEPLTAVEATFEVVPSALRVVTANPLSCLESR